MDIEALKKAVENGEDILDNFLIFWNSENSFLANQYVNAIANIKHLDVLYLKDLSTIKQFQVSLFDDEVINYLRVYRCDKLDIIDENLFNEKNLIIITDNIVEEDVEVTYSEHIVKMPKLEEWQIKDYAYAKADGVEEANLDWLISLCNNNIFRLDQELDKISIFDRAQRNIIFQDFVREDVFGDLSQYNIFNITNAIQSRDIEKLKAILPEIEYIDVEAVGVVTILNSNFKKMIQVWLSSNPTSETIGLKPNQIYAIKNLPHNYSKEQLIKIFDFLTSLDAQLKQGNLPVNIMVDYIIIKILSM